MTEGTNQGLFIVVAVIIFGIFVSIAYLLFYDNLKPALAGIFKDSITQVEDVLNGEGIGNKEENQPILEGTLEDGYIYANFRTKSNPVDIWVKMEVLEETNNLRVISSGYTKETAKQNSKGNALMTGSLIIPDSVSFTDESGIKQTSNVSIISNESFKSAQFTGDFIAPKATSIEANAFLNSIFKGTFVAKNIENIGKNAFYTSIFTGDFIAPKATSIEGDGFYNSKFNGDFLAPELSIIGVSSFEKSIFKGTFVAENIETVGKNAFYKSEFTGNFIAPKATSIEEDAFKYAKFNGTFVAENIETIGKYAFYKSEFTGTLNIDNVTELGSNSFHKSKFSGLKAENLIIVSKEVFTNSSFEQVNAPKLTESGVDTTEKGNGNLIEMLRNEQI